MTTAIAVHLGMLVLLLRPASYQRAATPVVERDASALELRFIPRRAPPPPAPRPVASHPVSGTSSSMRPERPGRPAARHAAHVAATPPETNVPGEPPPPAGDTTSAAPTTATAPSRYTSSQASAGDGGFEERLRDARHANDIHGVPGSDTRVAPGIQLTDPMDQGIGAAMRKTQRLFGIPDSHCIDVEVWQHLSPDELIARHVSPDDVKRTNEKYNCNRPMGLSF